MKRVDQWETVIAIAMHVQATPVRNRAKRIPVHNAFRIANALDKLARLARTLTRYYVWQGNENTDPHTCKACGGSRPGPHTYTNCAGAKVYALQSRAEKIGEELGLFVENQTDPRGASIKVYADSTSQRLLGVMS